MAQTDFPTKVLIHAQGTLTWARLNQKMRPVNYQPCAPAAPMSLDAFLADATTRGRPFSEVMPLVAGDLCAAVHFDQAEAGNGQWRTSQVMPNTGSKFKDTARFINFVPRVAPYAVAAGQQQEAALVPNRIERIGAGMANEFTKKAFAIPGEAEIPQAHLFQSVATVPFQVIRR